MGYIAQTKDYWIAPNAVYITLNALGEANRIQGSVASGTSIMCWIDGVDGLGYTNGHEYNTWPISLSPSFFNDNDPRYVYCAIPRTASIGTQAVIVFPSEKLDIYGVNAGGDQIGSVNYYYIFLQGVIGAPSGNPLERNWSAKITDWGQLDTAGGRDAKRLSSEWYEYSLVSEVVTLLKEIKMHTTSWFANLRLGGDRHNLTGVATASTADDFIDSDELVATPSYINARSLSKTHEDVAAAKITFQEGLESKSVKVTGSNGTTPDTDNITQKEVGLDVTHSGVIGGILRVAKSLLTKTIQSLNFSGGDSLTGTGWQLTDDYGNGRSRLVVDDAVFRGKVTLNELEVRKLMAMGGNYVFSPAASVIEEVDYYGYVVVPGEQEPAIELLGYEYIKVPWVLRLIPLSLRGRYLSKKKWVRSTMSQDDYARVVFYRCWLKADDGSTQTINTWRIGMLARCQTFDASQIENGTHEETYSEAGGQWTGKDVTNKLYWRAVTAAAQGVDKNNYDGKSVVLDDGRKHNYIDLSNGYQGNIQLYLDGSDHVSAGDHIVCFGDWKDANLSHFVTIETIGDDAPAVKEFRGVGYTDGASIDWSLDGKCKTKISPVASNAFYAPHFYVETSGSVRDVATFMVSTDGILAEVKSVQNNGKNLLSGVLTGKGWYDEDGNESGIDADGAISSGEDEMFSSVVSRYTDKMTLSFYYRGTFAIDMQDAIQLVDSQDDTNIDTTKHTYKGIVSGDTVTINGHTYVRCYYWISRPSWDFRILFLPDNPPYIFRPQLENGYVTPTAFDAGGNEVSSSIRQTAGEIELKVKDELGETGIDIENHEINMSANQFTLKNLNGETVMSADSQGNVGISGTIVAKNLYRGFCVAYPFDSEPTDGQAQYYNKEGEDWRYVKENVALLEYIEDYYPSHPEYANFFTLGNYVDRMSLPAELVQDGYIERDTGLIRCTGYADLIVICNNGQFVFADNAKVRIPRAQDFAGKTLEIKNMAHHLTGTTNVDIDIYQVDYDVSGSSGNVFIYAPVFDGSTPMSPYPNVTIAYEEDIRLFSDGTYWLKL